MQFNLIRNIVANILSLTAVLVLSLSCGSKIANEGNVVFTQVPVSKAEEITIRNGSYRYTPSMKIAWAEMGEPMENIEVLTPDFYSARAPEISFDGLQMVFSGQLQEGDVWQIWTMDLGTRELTQVSHCEMNCTDPTWLPGDRIAFSKLITENNLEHHALFTIAVDGCCEQRITFQPHDDLNASVMHDGRILVSSQQVYPESGQVKYLAMRPDGTKAELFYPSENGRVLGEAEEDGNGQVLFTESGSLSAVKFSRPLMTKNKLTSHYLVNSIENLGGYNLVFTLKASNDQTFGLAMFNHNDLDKALFRYNDPHNHLIEAVVISQKELPRNLPSRVDTEKETGYFVCMDANESDTELDENTGEAAKIQVLGLDAMIGETEVAEDGSFYLELKADQPIRFQTLNESGEVLRGPSSWMWVRPNERRGCVGCHEDRELAPENVVPLAIEKAPVAMIK